MKPVHEEEWKYDPREGINSGAFVVAPGPNNGFFGACEGNSDSCGSWAEFDSTPEDHARARLAAQAPAMARLLLELSKEIEWSNRCSGCKRDERPSSDRHAPNCDVIAVLKAAGVMP